MKRAVSALVLFLAVCVFATPAFAAQKCLDAADEPHHRVIFENKDVRILQLDLARLQSTSPYCYAGPFLYIITTETRSSIIQTGNANSSHDWKIGEGRFVGVPVERTVRNETIVTHREVIIETRRTVQYDPLHGNYDRDEFPGDPGPNNSSWTVYFSRGSLTAQKTQLAPGDHTDVGTPDHLLIAIDDLKLTSDGPKKKKDINFNRADTAILEGGSAFTLTNRANAPGKFILVEF